MLKNFPQFSFKSSTWSQRRKKRKRENQMELSELSFQRKKPDQDLSTSELKAPASLRTNAFTSHWFQWHLHSVVTGPSCFKNYLSVQDFAHIRRPKGCVSHTKAHGFGKGALHSVEECNKALLAPLPEVFLQHIYLQDSFFILIFFDLCSSFDACKW